MTPTPLVSPLQTCLKSPTVSKTVGTPIFSYSIPRPDRPFVPPHPDEAAVTKKPRVERMPYRPMPSPGSPPSLPQSTAAGPPANGPSSSTSPVVVPVTVRQSSAAPLNTLGLGSLPSTHEGVVPDPLMCATLLAPVESSLDELWAADEAAAVVSTTPHAHHRSPSIGLTSYDVNVTALPSFTRALAPGGSVAATPKF